MTASVFRNIRYAQAERFGAANLVPFQEVVPDAARGPVAPQLRSRLDTILGPPKRLEQSEDCQVLSVFAPSTNGNHPVMMWFHGGASITGGGELPWYDGGHLADEQGVVVVSVTSRLGALGHASTDEHGRSPATSDQLAAIEWVHRHIGEFGGDPQNITLFGQSAGAYAIEVILRWGVGPHVTGAILQSGFLSQPGLRRTADKVDRQSAEFARLLTCHPDDASVTEILHVQAAMATRAGNEELWAPAHPERPAPIDIPLIAGSTLDDSLPFFLLDRAESGPTTEEIDGLRGVVESTNKTQVIAGNNEVLREAGLRGHDCWSYLWTGFPSGSPWRASHCVELPFLLGSAGAWKSAPVLGNMHWRDVVRAGTEARSAWASFARTHDPGPTWSKYVLDADEIDTPNRVGGISHL